MRILASLTLAGLLVLAGCGQDSDPSTSPVPPASPSLSSSPVPSTSPVPSEPGVPSPDGPSTPGTPARELTGTVTEGVEAGCLVLAAEGVEYLLVGGDPTVLRPGSRVVVTGYEDPGVVSICQQGVAFQVLEARPA